MITADTVVALSLEEVIKHYVRALFRRFHLSRDYIIGLVGERGSGKSLSGGNIAVRDFAMNGEPLWSNMEIRLDVNMPDDFARYFALPAGKVSYQAEHIEKEAFLALDSRYEGGCFFFDEFNLEYGEARRSGANINLMTDRAIQQLRKLQSGLIYTVINEMYVDSRIRENTDLFIRCADVAFKPENLRRKMTQGVAFEWLLYPMTPKLFGYGQTYDKMGKPIGPIAITMGHLWGSIDTYERQAVGALSYTQPKQLLNMQMVEDPKVVVDRDRWGWLDKSLTAFFEKHTKDGDVIEISSNDFRHELGVKKEQWGAVVNKIYDRLPDMGSSGAGGRRHPTQFKIFNRVLV